MLTFEYGIFLSIAKFYNPALTQRGHYRVAFSLDETGLAQLKRVTIYGEGHVDRNIFYSKCVYVSIGRDSFPSIGSCVFHISIPISSSMLSAKDQSVQIILNTEFQQSPGDNLPRGERCFQMINQRQLSLTLTSGLCNNHFLTLTSGSIQIAAVGVQIHASLTGMNISISNPSPPLSNKAFTQLNPSFDSLLFDTTNPNSTSRPDRAIGVNAQALSEQGYARLVFRTLEEVLQRSYAEMRNILISYSTFTKVQIPNLPECLALDDDLAVVLQSPVQIATLTRNIAEIISELSLLLNKLWKKFIWNVHGNEFIIKHLAIIYHREKVQYMRQSIRSSTTDNSFCADDIYLEDETQIRNSQQVKYYQHMKPRVYCVETMGAQQDKIFIEEIIYTPSKEEITQNQILRNGLNHSFENLSTSPTTNSMPQFSNHKIYETKLSHPSISISENSEIKPKSNSSQNSSAEISTVQNGSDVAISTIPPPSSLNTYTPKHKTVSSSSKSEDQVLCACLPFKRRAKKEKNKAPRVKVPNRYFSQEEFFYPLSANQASTPIPPKDTSTDNRSHRYVHITRGIRHLKLHSPPLHGKRGSVTETASDPGPKLREARRSLLEDSSRSSQNCTDLDEAMGGFDSEERTQSSASDTQACASTQVLDANSQLIVTLELDAQTQSVAGAGFQGRNPSFREECNQKEISISINDEKLQLEDSALERSMKLHPSVMRSCSPPTTHSFELSHSSSKLQTASYNSLRHRDVTATPTCISQFRDITSPYLPQPLFYEYSKDYHLVVCVHGLEGNSYDLRLFKTYLSLALPKENLEFLMSDINQGNTFSDIEDMTDNLMIELFNHLASSGPMPPKYISFIGHSLGNLIIRRLLDREEMKPLFPKLSVFLSLCGPHLGTLVGSSGLVQAGLWFLQKWHKSTSILQLQLKDGETPRESLLYRLSTSRGIQNFRYVVLVGSPQDKYAPYFSSLLHPCPNYDQVPVYREMLENFLAVLSHSNLQLIRYKVHYNIPPSPGNFIGRSAHIAVLDSEQFVEKFVLTCLAPYFADTSLH